MHGKRNVEKKIASNVEKWLGKSRGKLSEQFNDEKRTN